MTRYRLEVTSKGPANPGADLLPAIVADLKVGVRYVEWRWIPPTVIVSRPWPVTRGPRVTADIRRRTKNVERLARATAPVQTGKLKRSVKSRMRGSVGEVSVGGRPAPYALPVVLGSRPHAIVARRGKVLRFETGGKVVFARRVQHPGAKANRFLVNALRAARS